MSSETIEKHIAVYEKISGRVIQIHQFVAFKKDYLPSLNELASESIKSASSINKISKNKLATLEVTKEQIKRGVKFKIDIKNKKLLIPKSINEKGSKTKKRLFNR